MSEMTQWRSKLHVEGVNAWTDRVDVNLRGLPAQLNKYNFHNECLNIRAMRWMKLMKLEASAQLPMACFPDWLMTDVRQHVGRQSVDGRCQLLSGSVIYWHREDRTLAPLEHMFHLGYGDHLELDGIDKQDTTFPKTLAEFHAMGPECAAHKPAEKPRVRRGTGATPYGYKLARWQAMGCV